VNSAGLSKSYDDAGRLGGGFLVNSNSIGKTTVEYALNQ
jgi:hypothetical protein